MWKIKPKSPWGAPEKGASFFGPHVWSVMVGCFVTFLAVSFILALINEPAFRINLAGLWLKFWYGGGYWEVARYTVYFGGIAALWITCDILEAARKRERFSDDH